jgi:hypothetical protein
MVEKMLDPSIEEIVEVPLDQLNIIPAHELSPKKIQEINETIKLYEVKPTPLLDAGLQLARAEILRMEHYYDIVVKNPEDLKVVFLHEQDLRSIETMINPDDPPSGGFTATYLEVPVVEYVDVPEYYRAGLAFHEWEHTWIDRKISAREKVTEKGFEDGYVPKEETRRYGVMIRDISQFNEKGESVYLGIAINELGNYMGQKYLMFQCLNNPLFTEEAQHREVLLKRLGHKSEDATRLYDATYGDNKKQAVAISASNIHCDNEDFFYLGVITLSMQLGTDLAKVCNTTEEHVRELIEETKVRPTEQKYLHELIVSGMGEEFYQKMRRSEDTVEDIIALLKEVQDKVYPQKTQSV